MTIEARDDRAAADQTVKLGELLREQMRDPLARMAIAVKGVQLTDGELTVHQPQREVA
jgi:ribosome-binding factor A